MAGNKQILYGIGKAALRDYADPKKLISLNDMQDLTIESSFSAEDITGGNKMFPIASFPKDKSLKISATNATFNVDLIDYLEGAEVATEKVTLAGMMEVKVPEDGIVNLEHTPTAGTVLVMGFESGEEAAEGTFAVEGNKITFATADAGKLANIFYEYEGSSSAVEYGVGQKTMAKPFIFDYTFPIYDEDTQITHYGTLRVFKAKCTSGFSIDPKHNTPVAPKFEATAQDPQRVDGKMWSLSIDGKTI